MSQSYQAAAAIAAGVACKLDANGKVEICDTVGEEALGITLQAATVQYELQAPIDRGITLRAPAFKQLRFMAFTGVLTGKGGRLHVWQNGRQVVDYQGALGFKDDENEIVFKFGLCRDTMDRPFGLPMIGFARGKPIKS